MSTTTTTALGFIYPDHAAEDDYPLAERLLREAGIDVSLNVAHIYGTDLHAIPELLDLGSPDKLADGASLLADADPAAVIWACTSGSFVYGPDGAPKQVAALAQASRVAASSTSFAFVNAAKHLGVSRVAVAASYPDDVAQLFVQFLAAAGIEVLGMSSAGIDTAAEVGTLTSDQVCELAASNDRLDAQALLIPDTAMHTIGVLQQLEAQLGKPVLTANQVTIWEALRLANITAVQPALGALFNERPHYGDVRS
ncbi:maleate cis-trans isomerase [Hoyosella rhizosphaerae]|uniref:Decarboxylase n=1 Tax=Hoyosella rhizosphaerae TaxID=1755582 RepID=A0A916UCZ2_9ACTN|nr:maleate cis-trans isomerase [Hoyosella rhizosphaerae]MBN4925812.1 maleate cis-trans isomerase [Hoyosella rhizosphaerae]GGC67765.1 putative decarboxylase [Hoyosella rhizosphaerae]